MLAATGRAARALTSFTIAAALVVTSAPTATAQDAEPAIACEAQAMVGDACQKTLDIFTFASPQLAMLLTGGSATPGQYQALGRLGRFSINVRATASRIDLPQVGEMEIDLGPAVRSTIPTSREWGAGPAIDAEFGVFGGIPLGLTRVGAVDLLASAFYIPDIDADDVVLEVDGNGFRFGGGVRIGVVEEGLAWPGVSVSWLRRGLPTMNIVAVTDDADELRVSDLSLDSDALRLMVGKRLGFLGLHAGVGQDRYSFNAEIAATVHELGETVVLDPIRYERTMTRTNVFGGISLNFPVIRLVGEVGQVSGGSAPTYNEFDSGDAARARTYMSIGLRAGI